MLILIVIIWFRNRIVTSRLLQLLGCNCHRGVYWRRKNGRPSLVGISATDKWATSSHCPVVSPTAWRYFRRCLRAAKVLRGGGPWKELGQVLGLETKCEHGRGELTVAHLDVLPLDWWDPPRLGKSLRSARAAQPLGWRSPGYKRWGSVPGCWQLLQRQS